MDRLDLEVVFNQFEALLWLAISMGILIYAIVQRLRKIPVSFSQFTLIPAFAVFGLSDLIEAKTGAWWTPWWLFVMKILCVLAFLAFFINHLKSCKKKASSSGISK